MAITALPDGLVERTAGGERILLIVMDGIGGLPHPDTGHTELETAATPHLDSLAAAASLGMLLPVGHGITPGSGPGHLSLFGYDPLEYQIGRGALSALGVGFDLEAGDLAVRLNLASLDGDGRITDRRAGRPSDAEGRRVVDRIRTELNAPADLQLFIEHVKEHRAVLVFRGPGLSGDLADTDPQETGVPPHRVRALREGASEAASLVQGVLSGLARTIADEPVINGILARGFAMYEGYPSLEERFGLRALAVAQYPMYRGVARLVGMDVRDVPSSNEEAVAIVERLHADYDFVFVHFKATDARGEDGDFEAKTAAAEAIDSLIPRFRALGHEVVIVTGDHSTPAIYGAHSWHSVPVLIASRWARPTGGHFDETHCRVGDLGSFEGRHLMSLALAHAGRLAKFGA
jgi:2,3-bisphosphoglycerate-independent phosphoglycerate mutase